MRLAALKLAALKLPVARPAAAALAAAERAAVGGGHQDHGGANHADDEPERPAAMDALSAGLRGFQTQSWSPYV